LSRFIAFPNFEHYFERMSTAELVVEKVRLLSEAEVKSVLAYIVQLKSHSTPTAGELRRMPRAERSRILSEQGKGADALYRHRSDLIVEDFDPPLDYEQGDAR
jgi:hypothetical protein